MKHRLVGLLLCILIVVCGSGCETPPLSTDSKTDDTSAQAGVEPTRHLEIQAGTRNFMSERVWNRLIGGFENKYPRITVTLHDGENVNKEMEKRWETGDPPDLILMDGDVGDTLPGQDKLADLREWFDVRFTPDDFLESLREPLEQRTLREIPLFANIDMLWYDQNWYKRRTLSPPVNADGLFDLQGDPGKIPDLVVCEEDFQNFLWAAVMPMVLSQGGESLYDGICRGSADAYSGSEFLTVLNRLEKLHRSGFLKIEPLQDPLEAWCAGKSTYYAGGTWIPIRVKSQVFPDFELKAVPDLLRKEGQTRYAVANYTSIGMAADTQNREAALLFLEYLFSAETQTVLLGDMRTPSALRVSYQQSSNGTMRQLFEVLCDPDLQIVPRHAMESRVQMVLTKALTRLLNGELTANQTAQYISDSFKE